MTDELKAALQTIKNVATIALQKGVFTNWDDAIATYNSIGIIEKHLTQPEDGTPTNN